jgi:hypothetical protein
MNPFEEAGRELDDNYFAEAMNLYRAAMKSYEPPPQILPAQSLAVLRPEKMSPE